MGNYRLSFEAETDIVNMVTYGAEKWGRKQAVKYSQQLENCMEKLANQEIPYKKLDDFKPPILVKSASIIIFLDNK